jgi:xanthine/uracil/vitamin C permease (AzgA family)
MEAVDKYFKLTERGSTILTEFRAGTATFMTLCYILAGLSACPKLSDIR